MRKIGASISEFMSSLAVGDDVAQKAQRAAAVNVAWRNAVESVYKDAADMVLDHVNAVYIMAAGDDVYGARPGAPSGGTGSQLVVYADDSLIRSDLDARQEFLKMKLKEQGEHVDSFKILPSRFEMKSRHPFRREQASPAASEASAPSEGQPLDPPMSDARIAELEESVGAMENAAVREALIRAIHADNLRKKG